MTTVFIISAPSGSGKSTLVARLLATMPGLMFSVSYTTRKPRGQEVDGENYRFVTREAFEEMIANDEFLPGQRQNVFPMAGKNSRNISQYDRRDSVQQHSRRSNGKHREWHGRQIQRRQDQDTTDPSIQSLPYGVRQQ